MKKLFLLLLLIPSLCFAQKSKTQLKTLFDQIKNETASGANTNQRIGNAFQMLADASNPVIAAPSTTGTNSYVVDFGIGSMTSYIKGDVFFAQFTNSNTGSATINIADLGAKTLKRAGGSTNLSSGDLLPNAMYILYYDGTNFQVSNIGGSGGGGGSSTYGGNSPTTVSVGGLNAGTAISGDSYDALFQAILAPYINPFFNSFSISVSSPQEVGTTLTGSKTATWSINSGSGTVSTIDIFDNTASTTLLAATPNDGSQSVTITTLQLNSEGASQSWKGIGNNSSPPGTFNSGNYVVTAYFKRFYGPVSSTVTNSATVRALPQNDFQNSTSFTLLTGTTLVEFDVALPPGHTITHVVDTDALGADITASYVAQSNINVLDAGSTNRSYNIYKYVASVPYTTSHHHVVTTN